MKTMGAKKKHQWYSLSFQNLCVMTSFMRLHKFYQSQIHSWNSDLNQITKFYYFRLWIRKWKVQDGYPITSMWTRYHSNERRETFYFLRIFCDVLLLEWTPYLAVIKLNIMIWWWNVWVGQIILSVSWR